MTDKHTPGPWTMKFEPPEPDYEYPYATLTAGEEGCWQETAGNGFRITGIMSEADAQLIVAAPDLLTACRDFINHRRRVFDAQMRGDLSKISTDSINPIIDAIEAAIAKANRMETGDITTTEHCILCGSDDRNCNHPRCPHSAMTQHLAALEPAPDHPEEKDTSGDQSKTQACEASDPAPQTHQEPSENVIETWARRVYYPGCGRSAGAAARDLISDLGANGCAANLKRMLEDMLDDFNRASHDHSETRETLRDVVRDIPKN